MMEKISCPDCNSQKVQRYGKTAAGRQKYRCIESGCRRQFVEGSDHLVKSDVMKVVLGLLKEGVPPGKIHGAVKGISKRRIYQLRRVINDK